MKYPLMTNHFLCQKSRIIGVLLLSLLLASCRDFLKELPDNRLKITNLEEVSWLLPQVQHGIVHPSLFLETLSDNVTHITGVVVNPYQFAWYQWKTFLPSPPAQADGTSYGTNEYGYWYDMYEAIEHANEALYALNQVPVKTAEDEKLRDAIQGEALLARAYHHFMLVNVFALHYNRETAAQNPGIPYLTAPEKDFITPYARQTVAEVYQKVEEDMQKGMKRMNALLFAHQDRTKYMFTQEAAWAFASRYYLFKYEWDSCIRYSNKLLGATPEKYIRDLTSDEYKGSKHESEAFQRTYGSYELPANVMLAGNQSDYIGMFFNKAISFGPTESLVGQLYGNSTRLSPPLALKTLYDQALPFPGYEDARFKGYTIDLRKEYYAYFFSARGYVHSSPSFRGEEVVLNRAEAYTHQGKLALALADLQLLTDKRYKAVKAGFPKPQLSLPMVKAFLKKINFPGVDTLSPQQALLQYVLLERRKEFFQQGMRWFDIKRHRLPVKHVLNNKTYTLKADDRRKALQIPLPAIDVNKVAPNEY